MARAKRVGLLLYLNTPAGRGCMEGVRSYCHETGVNWQFDIRWNILEETFVTAVRECDAIIVKAPSHAVADLFAASGVPTVNVSCIANDPLPAVRCDFAAVGRMGAEHFLARGFRHFAVYRSRFGDDSTMLEEAFRDRVRQDGMDCVACHPVVAAPTDAAKLAPLRTHIARWIRRLPRHTAIMVPSDPIGQLVVEACRNLQIAIPEDVAVLGVGNDELFCQFSAPPLSSIAINGLKIGYQAAALLHRLLSRKPKPSATILVPPLDVVVRSSTNVFAELDSRITKALQFINEHACDPIRVTDVATRVSVCRRALERQFRQAVKATPHQVIRQTQIERAKQLLQTTRSPVHTIAVETGFNDAPRLTRAFHKLVGQTPVQYRRINSIS